MITVELISPYVWSLASC